MNYVCHSLKISFTNLIKLVRREPLFTLPGITYLPTCVRLASYKRKLPFPPTGKPSFVKLFPWTWVGQHLVGYQVRSQRRRVVVRVATKCSYSIILLCTHRITIQQWSWQKQDLCIGLRWSSNLLQDVVPGSYFNCCFLNVASKEEIWFQSYSALYVYIIGIFHHVKL